MPISKSVQLAKTKRDTRLGVSFRFYCELDDEKLEKTKSFHRFCAEGSVNKHSFWRKTKVQNPPSATNIANRFRYRVRKVRNQNGFIFGYLMIWAIIYCIIRKRTERLNEILKKKQESERV